MEWLDKLLNKNRYERQISYIGRPAQARLKKTVCIIGAGGLGTNTADMLARSGIRTIRMLDHDTVDISNLHRQVLYTEADIGQQKVGAAASHLSLINRTVRIEAVPQRLTSQNTQFLKSDLVLDCSDSMPTRLLINRYCIENRIPWVYCSVAGDCGYAKLITTESACLACFMANTRPKDAHDIGVLNTAVQFASSLQAGIALRFLMDEEHDTVLYNFNIWNFRLRKIDVPKKKGCSVC